MLFTILVVVQVLVAISLVGLILIQHGKGADAGAAFGSGASGTVFGAQGAANFLSRATAALATAFFVISLALAYLVGGGDLANGGSSSVTDQIPIEAPGSKLLEEQEAMPELPQAAPQSSQTAPQSSQTSEGNDGAPTPSPDRLPD